MVMLVLARFWNGPDNLSVLASFSGTPIEGFFTAPKARDVSARRGRPRRRRP
jgi:hypothetical protein